MGERLAAQPVAPKAPPEPEYRLTSRLLAAEEHQCLGPPEAPRAERERPELPERLELPELKSRHRWSLSWKPRLRDA